MLVSRICLKEGISSSTTQLITVHITRFAPWKPCNDVYNLFLVPCMRHESGPWHTTLTPFSRKSNNIMYCWPRHVTMSSSSCSLQSHSSDLTYYTTVWDQCLGTKDARLSWRFVSRLNVILIFLLSDFQSGTTRHVQLSNQCTVFFTINLFTTSYAEFTI